MKILWDKKTKDPVHWVWDLRCTDELIRFFPERRGYWFKVNRKRARKLVKILARAYHVRPPQVDDVTPRGHNGLYYPDKQTMSIWSMAHVKTVMHEFYHHLDNVTEGRYDSNDNPPPRRNLAGGFHGLEKQPSYGWQFAEKLFNLLREHKPGIVYTEEDMAKKNPKTNPVVAHARKMTKGEEKSVKAQLKNLIEKSGAIPASHAKAAGGGKPPKEELADLAKRSEGLGKSMKERQEREKKGVAKKGNGGGIKDEQKIKVLFKKNPKREGSSAFAIYELFQKVKTVGEFRDKCRTQNLDAGYLNGALRRNEIKLEG